MDQPVMARRHGCLTAYLIFMIALNALVGLFYAGSALLKLPAIARLPEWAYLVLCLGAAANVGFAVALLRNKRWGFLGFTAISVCILFVNLRLGVSLGQAVVGLFGVAVVFGLLQLGKPSGWDMLE